MITNDNSNGQAELNDTLKEFLQANNLNLSNMNGYVDVNGLFQYLLDIDLINESQFKEIRNIITT